MPAEQPARAVREDADPGEVERRRVDELGARPIRKRERKNHAVAFATRGGDEVDRVVLLRVAGERQTVEDRERALPCLLVGPWAERDVRLEISPSDTEAEHRARTEALVVGEVTSAHRQGRRSWSERAPLAVVDEQ